MGRPPCSEKGGVKKGPWTPEEDIMLVSYVQEHGPGNWRAVPTTTGLHRCSKSCRLRWTNYLRPGIKRGSFTDNEEKMIIQLQALLGNKWAAIASYLPERTDNDIKNYWNTHLKKKLKKLQEAPHEGSSTDQYSKVGFSASHSISRGQWEKRLQTDINKAKKALNEALSLEIKPSPVPEFGLKSSNGYLFYNAKQVPSAYASNTENIARLLKGWVKNSPIKASDQTKSSSTDMHSMIINNTTMSYSTCSKDSKNGGIDLSKAFKSIFGFESLGSLNSESMSPEASLLPGERKPDLGDDQVPLSMLENWLFDEAVQGKEEFTNFSFDESETVELF